jgi:hypothetical protein
MRARRPRVGRKNCGAARRAVRQNRDAYPGRPGVRQPARLSNLVRPTAHTRRSINYGLQGGGGSRPRPSKGLLFRQCLQGLSWGSVPRQSYPQQSGVLVASAGNICARRYGQRQGRRGGGASSAPGTMARTRGWPTPAGIYARRSRAAGATTGGAPGRCRLTGSCRMYYPTSHRLLPRSRQHRTAPY